MLKMPMVHYFNYYSILWWTSELFQGFQLFLHICFCTFIGRFKDKCFLFFIEMVELCLLNVFLHMLKLLIFYHFFIHHYPELYLRDISPDVSVCMIYDRGSYNYYLVFLSAFILWEFRAKVQLIFIRSTPPFLPPTSTPCHTQLHNLFFVCISLTDIQYHQLYNIHQSRLSKCI